MSLAIGFIGLGTMGAAMAARLISAGFDVTGYDLDAEALRRFEAQGGRPASGPDATAAAAQALVVVVQDAVQVDTVLFGPHGATQAMRPGAVVWLATTVSPTYVRGLEARLKASGLLLVDGPVTGGWIGARDGTLSVIAGATPVAFDKLAPAMAACTAHVHRVGPVGAASTIKMVNQLLAASHIALTAEALALSIGAGADPSVLIDIITHSSGASLQFEKRAPRMLAADHTPHATVNIWLKDLGIALAAARELDVAVPMASASYAVFLEAAARGQGAASDTVLLDIARGPCMSRTDRTD